MAVKRHQVDDLAVFFGRMFFLVIMASVTVIFVWRDKYAELLSVESLISYSVFLACTVAMFLPRRFLIPTLLSCCSLMTAVFGANLVLEFVGTPQSQQQAAGRLGVAFDRRTRTEALRALAEQGVEAVAPVCSVNVIEASNDSLPLMPLSGFPNLLTVHCNELGHFTTYTSDRYGFNNPDSVYDLKGPRVLLLGDSFAHGACVPQGQDVASVLRRMGLLAINMGCGGNGPLAMLATYAEYGRSVGPTHAIWMYYEGNDLNDVSSEKASLLVNYLDADFTQDLVRRQSEVVASLSEVAVSSIMRPDTPWTRMLTLYSLRRLFGLAGRGPTVGERVEEDLLLLRSILTEFSARTELDGVRPIFVYLPSYRTVSRGRPSRKRRYAEDYREAVTSIVRDLGIEMVDFERRLVDSADPLSLYPFRSSGHFNASGYRLLAEAIADALKDIPG